MSTEDEPEPGSEVDPKKRDENASKKRVIGRPFEAGNKAAVGHGRPKISPNYRKAIKELEPMALQALGEILDESDHPQRAAVAQYVVNRRRGRPLDRSEITGKNGKDLIPTRDDAIEALKAVVPRAAVTAALAPTAAATPEYTPPSEPSEG